MSVLDSSIFFTICETTLELFKETKHSTYRSYCKSFALRLNTFGVKRILTARDKHHMLTIMNDIELIYGIDSKKAGEYVVKFFASDLFVEYQIAVETNKRLFPFTYGLSK